MSNIFLILAFVVSLAVIIGMIMSKKFNPSFCLFVGALVAAFVGRMPLTDIASTLNTNFGTILSSVGILLLFANIYSQYLNDTGITQEFAKTLIRKVGLKYDLLAIAVLGYFFGVSLGIVVACAVVGPMLRALSQITKRPLPAYVCAFATPCLLTTCAVVPTSGPVVFGGMLGLNLGVFMIYGLIVTIPGLIVCTLIAYWLSGKLSAAGKGQVEANESTFSLDPDPTKPGMGLSLFLLIIPIVLITAGAFLPRMLNPEGTLFSIVSFTCNSSIVFVITAILTMILLRKYISKPSQAVFSEGIVASGPFLVMMGCAQCYGGVLIALGVGDYVVSLLSNTALPLLFIALILMIAIHAGTGAGFVAGTTTISLLMSAFEASGSSMMLFGLVCGIGQLVLFIPTDLTFWFIKDSTGIEFGDTVKALCIPATIVGVVCFIIILIMQQFTGVLPAM